VTIVGPFSYLVQGSGDSGARRKVAVSRSAFSVMQREADLGSWAWGQPDPTDRRHKKGLRIAPSLSRHCCWRSRNCAANAERPSDECRCGCPEM